MIKLLNKLFYILKNILLPITFIATIYIITFMFQRLEKELFGANFMEFLATIFPYLLLMILYIINSFLNQKSVKDNFFYNITSFIVTLTISIFVYRALFDQNMYLWHKYAYDMNFNYFADQIAPMKVMLYGLCIANIVFMINGYIKPDMEESKEIRTNKKKVSKKSE